MSIHLVSLTIPTFHETIPLPPSLHSLTPMTCSTPSSSLPPNNIRLAPTLLGIAANNLTYYARGALLGWHSAFPSSLSSHPPSSHVIVPGWGYATVLASTIPSIPAGKKVWGFFPLSSAPVDLLLAPASEVLGDEERGTAGARQGATHWVETSDQRKGLMSVYNRYIVRDADQGTLGRREEVRVSLRPVWELGHLFGYVFPGLEAGEGMRERPVGTLGGSWGSEDGDLGGAVVVSLGAASKTGRAVTWAFLKRVEGGGMKGLVLGASVVEGLRRVYGERKGLVVGAYENLPGLVEEVLQESGASKVVVIDNGSPVSVGPAVVKAVEGKAEVMVVFVGCSPATYKGVGENVKKVQANASGIKDEAMKRVGSGKYFEGLESDWEEYYQAEGETWEIVKKTGDEAIEETWTQLVSRGLKSAVVVRLHE
ncbi:Hypothetical protein D9617_7g032380 [Elsinoe fawcettii]|nr:Hypothetical protein D9617_7g032380 [Elsinoe fawcettii]